MSARKTYPCEPFEGDAPTQEGWGMLLEISQPVQGCPSLSERRMLVGLLGKLFVNPSNIPLRCFAFATRRGPPSKGEFPMWPYYPI